MSGDLVYLHVVIAVDETPAARDASALAADLAAPGADVIAAHVCERRDAPVDVAADVMLDGAFGPALEHLVRERGADLLVVGADRHHRVWTPDHTRKALHSLPCAVAVAPAGYVSRSGEHALDVIGVAYDETAEADAALAAARTLADRSGGQVRVIDVVRESNLPSADSREGWKAQQATARLAALEGVEVAVVEGDPVHELRAAATDVDLLVLGARHTGLVPALLMEDTAARLAGHVSCPLLVQPA